VQWKSTFANVFKQPIRQNMVPPPPVQPTQPAQPPTTGHGPRVRSCCPGGRSCPHHRRGGGLPHLQQEAL